MLSERDADHAVAVLNDLFKLEPKTMDMLISMRVNCGEAWADHPTCQVSSIKSEKAAFSVGMLGVINAIFGADEDNNGFIAAQYQDNDLIGFCRFDPQS